jgi:predicted nucleotidyltransferase
LTKGEALDYACRVSSTLPEDAFARLRGVLDAEPDVEVAACFGSAARGRMHRGSDVDVYVRLRRGASWSLHKELEVASDLSGACRREVDLIVEDEDRTSVILRLEVARHGRLVFERSPGAWVELRASAMVAHADLEPWIRRCSEGFERALALRVRGAHGG